MLGHYRSTIDSNFHFCISRNISDIIRHHCIICMDHMHYGLAQFLHSSKILQDTLGRYGYSFLLTRNEILPVF